MPKFKKCPRCEINYILEEQDYCEICSQELKGISVAEESDDDLETEICPRCRVNFISEGEKICENCVLEMELEKEKPIIDDVEPDWNISENDGDDEDLVDDEIDLSLDELAEDESNDEDEEEESIDSDDFFDDNFDDDDLDDEDGLSDEDDEY